MLQDPMLKTISFSRSSPKIHSQNYKSKKTQKSQTLKNPETQKLKQNPVYFKQSTTKKEYDSLIFPRNQQKINLN